MLVTFSGQIITMKFISMMFTDSVYINSITLSSLFLPLLLSLTMHPLLFMVLHLPPDINYFFLPGGEMVIIVVLARLSYT